jgi:hypothetical protein
MPSPRKSLPRRIVRRLIERRKITLPVGVLLVAVGAWLFFGFFGFHTLFFDETVAEGIPVFESGAGASGLPSDFASNEITEQMNAAMQEEETPAVVQVDEPMAMHDAPEIITVVEGTFIDRSHPTRGTAKVITDGSEQRFLRFENFRTDNGPDLNVYLSTAAPDGPAGDFDEDFIDLGDLKGNVGDQNYEIRAEVDLKRYSTVVIWCVRFSVAFGAAQLKTPAGKGPS